MDKASTHTVAVTGASGFVGRAVVPALAAAGHGVIALSRGAGGAQAAGVAWRQVDYADTGALARALDGVGTVVHLADDPDRTRARGAGAGEAMVRALTAAMARTGAGRLILASSVYARLAPQPGGYGHAKAEIESTAQKAAAESGLAHTVLRLPPVYGPGGRGGFAALAGLARRGIPLPFALARAPRDYLFVGNLADLIVCMAGADDATWEAAAGGVFEPSDGRPVATADLIRALARAQGRTARLIPVPGAALRLLGRLTGKAEMIAGALDPLATDGNGDLERIFGWRPARTIPESLDWLAA